ncbi:hypothetical protein V7x_02470 [Crateriforma conspicua]|uniref:Uncharacterized protein n=2 Tax=Planctomycetaceae TaxID=126 RepID=A0A5C6FU21_9PLAN|nr:hypothetical protein V7x_02470 [Crateriforma conspicua]
MRHVCRSRAAHSENFQKFDGIRNCDLNSVLLRVISTKNLILNSDTLKVASLRDPSFRDQEHKLESMNISNTNSSLSPQASAANTRTGGPPPNGKQAMTEALQSVGVDQSTASDVLQQIDDAISGLRTDSPSGSVDHQTVQSVIEDVLESNGIDSAKVGEAMRANGPSAASGSGRTSGASRPNRPSGPPPSDEDSDTRSLESALLVAGVDESSTDQLISQILETIDDLTSEASQGTSPDQIRSAITNVLQDNGVDLDAFQRAVADVVDPSGLFMDRFA